MPRLMEKVRKSCKAKTGSGVRWLSSQSSGGFDEENKRESGGILEEGSAVWAMAAASVHNDVFIESEERYDRASYCAHAYDGSLVRSFARSRGYEMNTQISF